MTALPLIESLLASDPRGGPHLVFDIDNTVADTRFRTLHVARAFDAALGTRHFTALGLEHVRLDGTATARAHGLDADVAAAFQAYWASDQGFWCGQCFAEDRPLRPVVDLARRGHAQGFEVVWLTGRVEALRDHTARWLREHGLPDARLVCKPDLSVRTARFKADYFAALGERAGTGTFITESAGDIALIQAELPNVRCILVDYPFREACALRGDTPVLAIELAARP